MNIHTVKFAVLGLRGVGKTTLITSMYEQTSACLQKAGLDFVPNTATSIKLRDHRLQLVNAAMQQQKKVASGVGIAAGADKNDYSFDIKFENKDQSELRVEFTDFPGGWLLDIN